LTLLHHLAACEDVDMSGDYNQADMFKQEGE
jgi:hypothetical protein